MPTILSSNRFFGFRNNKQFLCTFHFKCFCSKVLANLPTPKLKDQVINLSFDIIHNFDCLSFQVLREIDKLCEEDGELMHPLTSVHYNHSPGNGMFNSVHKSLPSLYPNLAPAKNNLNLSAPSAPEEPSPAYHEVHNPPWVHSKISPSSADITDARDGEGSSSSNESNSTSTEV